MNVLAHKPTVQPLKKIGMIGLDSSHAPAFAKLLHDESHPCHIPGFRVVAAYPGGSPGFALSTDRLPIFTEDLRVNHGVTMVDSIGQLPSDLDAIFIESVDSRQHLGQFQQIADRRLPVFIDKPVTASSADAMAIAELAAEKRTPVMTCSALRFGEGFERALATAVSDPIFGAELFGPMPFIPELPGYFWYGIHVVEMRYRSFGAGCRRVLTVSNERFDVITAEWQDGRMGTVRGSRAGHAEFGGTLHRERGLRAFEVDTSKDPDLYAGMVRAIAAFIGTRRSPIAMEESLELVRFLEAANASRAGGGWVEVG
jgi:predicted dehydrogenase